MIIANRAFKCNTKGFINPNFLRQKTTYEKLKS